MQDIEPFFKWREAYAVEEDPQSPFYGTRYDAWRQIYNFVIHPFWDDFDSETLFLKVLFADYEAGFAIIEMIGEWNDAIGNDIMHLKRRVAESMLDAGISKFIFIIENVLNYHSSEADYYEEWAEECRDSFNGGWIALLNSFDHVTDEMRDANLDDFMYFGIAFNGVNWRMHTPQSLFNLVEERVMMNNKRLF